jgi:ribosome modulation factor
MWSHGVQLCALILRVLNETLRARYQRHQGGIAGRSAHDAAYRQQRQRTIAAGRSISGLNLMSTAGRREHRRR